MKDILHILALHLNRQDKCVFRPLNSQYDIITRYYPDDNYQNILHKFNAVVIIVESIDCVDLTPILELTKKLGIKVFLPQDYNFDLSELEKTLLQFVENKEFIKHKRKFFDSKKLIVLGTEQYNKNYLKPDLLSQIDFFVFDDVLNTERFPKSDKLFFLINSEFSMYKNIKKRLEERGFKENIDFTSLENYCYVTDRGTEFFKNWEQTELDGSLSLKSQTWMDRTELMSQWILPSVTSIAEFGCGEAWLRNMFMPNDVKYIGIDYVKRNDETIVCDINSDPLPKLDVDLVFISGVLGYVSNLEKFFDYIGTLDLKQLLISYWPLELRTGLGYRYGDFRNLVSFFTSGELICLIQKKTNLVLEQSKICHTSPSQVVFDFQKNQ